MSSSCGYEIPQETEDRQRSSSSEKGWKKHRSKTTIISALMTFVAIFLVVASVVLMKLRSKRTETKAEIRSCTRHDCLLHKYELTKGINTSVDPCSDITAYVCSGLKPGPDYPNEMGLIRRWDEKGADYLERNQFHFKVTRKAAAMYRSCVKQEHANLTSAVIGFLRARGLHWPNEESSTVDPLDVVLDLLVNWGVPFWFEINLRKLPSQNRHSLSIGPVYSRALLVQRIIVLRKLDQQSNYATHFYNLYGYEVSPRDLQARLLTEESILTALEEAVGNRSSSSRRLPLSAIGKVTPNISPRRWLRCLNNNLHPHVVLPKDTVFLERWALLAQVSVLFGSFNNSQLLHTLGWWFVQEYSLLGSPEALLYMYGNKEISDTKYRLDCYATVESRFRNLLWLERTPKEAMVRVKRMLLNILNHTAILLNSSAWLESSAKQEATEILESITLKPLDMFLRAGDQILAEYNQFQSRSRFFIEYWIETAIEHKNVTSNWPYDDTLLTRNVRYSPVVKYAYFWNSIFVHMAALASPIFYANEMFSANYGGIGTLISQEVFRIFDKHAIALDVFRKNHSWMPEVSKRVLKAKKACFKAQHARLSDTAALLIAHRAYESAVQSPNSDTYAEDLGDNLTSDRVFFLTHCRTKCTVYPKRKNCHHAVRHLKAFGKAFRCGKNSPMVSPAMCSIF
ncbi:hypothetical protein HPB47_023877 [Ixodes persulcatus]|uniref:Uncharacterized protein n=1 Tax=Ixodes persulcatus TaxID=34615 RepID=A0AC60Q5T6_IXOPE|nr:hypothetical protein HPB47_023877 [Ixodes persulcatus]